VQIGRMKIKCRFVQQEVVYLAVKDVDS